MYFSLGDLVMLFLLGAVSLHFLASIRVRELAIQAVRRASKRDDFQFLDQSVNLNRVSLSRDAQGRWRVWRQYRFDYSHDGVERHQGQVTMLSKQLQSILVTERQPTVH